jgi:hypothetical protein
MIGRVWAAQRPSVSLSCGVAHSRGVGLEFRAFFNRTAFSWYGVAGHQNTRGFDQPSSLLTSTQETLLRVEDDYASKCFTEHPVCGTSILEQA